MGIKLILEMTSNTAPAPYVSSASHFQTANPPYMGFNNGLDSTSIYRSDTNMNASIKQWLGIDFGSTKKLEGFYLQAPSTGTSGMPKTFDIEYSLNGTDFIMVQSYSISKEPSAQEEIYFALNSVLTARHLRLVYKSTHANYASGRPAMGRWSFEVAIEPRTTLEFYDTNTLAKITSLLSGSLYKNGLYNKSLSILNGAITIENLDETSEWSFIINQNTSYNKLEKQIFIPTSASSPPVFKYNLKPTVKKKFNFFDENGVLLTGKNIKLKIYKDGSTTALVDTTVTTSTYTTTTLYDGSYTFEITCEGYNKIRGTLAYDNSELNINFTLFTPTNKTLILHEGEYKKWNGKIPNTYTENVIPKMTSNNSPFGTASASSIVSVTYDAWKLFDGINNTELSSWASAVGSTSNWIIYHFTTKQKIGKYGIHPYAVSSRIYDPKSWDFEGLDGNNWVILHSVTNYNFTANQLNEFEVTQNIGNYIAYRLLIKGTNGGNSCVMSGLEMYGVNEGSTAQYWSNQQLDLIQSDGMDSLSPLLDRRVETLELLEMTDKSEILSGDDVGKVFSKTLDLKKYMDIRSMKVEVK